MDRKETLAKAKNNKIISGLTVKRQNMHREYQDTELKLKQIEETLSNKKLKHKFDHRVSEKMFSEQFAKEFDKELTQNLTEIPTLRMPKDVIPDIIAEHENENDYKVKICFVIVYLDGSKK